MMRLRLARIALLLALLLAALPAAPVAPVAAGPAERVKGPLDEWLLRLTPSSRLSRQAKGELGELNIQPGMKALAKALGDDLEAERWFLDKGTLEHGVDSLFRNVSRTRHNVVEAKATSWQKTAYVGLLGESKAGEEMSDRWIRQSLSDLSLRAKKLAQEAGTSTERRRAADALLGTIDNIHRMRYKRIDKTLVITRLKGCEPDVLDVSRGVYNSVHPDLLRKFDNVIEMDKAGRVLHIYVGTR